MVTLLNMIVFGFAGRFGAITAKSVVNPSLLLVSALQNAVSTADPRGPISRSTCATSLPSPTSDSPTQTLLIFAMANYLPFDSNHGGMPTRCDGYPCCQRPAITEPVGQI